MNCDETVKVLTSRVVTFSEADLLEKVYARYSPDLLQDIQEYKRKQSVNKPTATTIDREKFAKSIDQVPKEVLQTSMPQRFKSKDFSNSMTLTDITNFTPEGYCSITLQNRVNRLKDIAKKHIKSQSEER